MVHNFYSLSIRTLIIRVFIIKKQEQTLLFLKFKARFFIYYNSLLKITDFIFRGSTQNPTKTDYFVGIRVFTTNHLLCEREENINVNI
jgi:hypothetical protein